MMSQTARWRPSGSTAAPAVTCRFLDMDERLIELAERADIVYSPLVDTKEYPEDVDISLVEGAVVERRGPAQDPARPRAHEDCSSRSATARSRRTCPGCATRSGRRRCCSAPTSRTSTSTRSHPEPDRPDAAARGRGRCTRW